MRFGELIICTPYHQKQKQYSNAGMCFTTTKRGRTSSSRVSTLPFEKKKVKVDLASIPQSYWRERLSMMSIGLL